MGSFGEGGSKGMRESCSSEVRRVRRDSTAKHTTKIAARQELTSMVTASTFTASVEQAGAKRASHGLRLTARIPRNALIFGWRAGWMAENFAAE